MGDIDTDYTAKQVFKPGHRVELHPACDLWMQGARFGTVVALRKGDVPTNGNTQEFVRVKLDNRAVKTTKLFRSEYLRHSDGR